MSIEEILNLHPRHIAALRDLYAGFPFDEVEIVAQETRFVDNDGITRTIEFDYAWRRIHFDNVVCGKKYTHALFTADENDTFYYSSFVRIGQLEDCVIFKIIRGVTP